MEITLTPAGHPCKFWPLGTCTRGNACHFEHHANLNPALVNQKAIPDHQVQNETGEACLRCMTKMYPCDKQGRGGEDDPCSECRWFGGENCRCNFQTNTSYNDLMWQTMMMRGAHNGYTLPDNKSREEGSGNEGTSQPISTHRLKAGWQGEAREVLLRKTDMLPPAVRQCPRAYLVPPRVSGAQQNSQNWHAAETPPIMRQRNESNPPSRNDAPMDVDRPGLRQAVPSDKEESPLNDAEVVDDIGYVTSDEEE